MSKKNHTVDAPVEETPVEQMITTTQEQPSNADVDIDALAPPAPGPKTYDLAELAKTYDTKSKMIRFLASEGLKVAQIHKMMVSAGYVSANGTPIRYQHVRNVLVTPAKKAETTTVAA